MLERLTKGLTPGVTRRHPGDTRSLFTRDLGAAARQHRNHENLGNTHKLIKAQSLFMVAGAASLQRDATARTCEAGFELEQGCRHDLRPTRLQSSYILALKIPGSPAALLRHALAFTQCPYRYSSSLSLMY